MDERPTRGASKPRRALRRLVGILGPTGPAAWQALAALLLSSTTSFVAGAALAAGLGELERHPGLTMMTAAAIGLRGNISGALGNRLSTAIHTGEFRVSLRPEGTLGQNVIASTALSVVMSLALAAVARVAAETFGVENPAPLTHLVAISVLGGVAASFVVTGATVGLSAAAVRYEWDLDSLVAPAVSTLGDVVTIPCLWAAAVVVRRSGHGSTVGWVTTLVALTALASALRTRRRTVDEILRESVPLLFVAMLLSTMAGLVITKRLETFASIGALLILFPAFVSSAGALGGILAARVATGLHLGTITPETRPGIEARRAMTSIALLAIPVFMVNGVGAHVVATITGEQSPGIPRMVELSVAAATIALAGAIAVAYYGTVFAYRVDLDPDSAATPIVTSSVDFLGAMSLVVVAVALGLG